jgi:hypothetical protein
MLEAHNKIVSIETFRAARPAARSVATAIRELAGAPRQPSARSIEHRERMLRFLRAAALERRQPAQATQPQEEQGCLLL